MHDFKPQALPLLIGSLPMTDHQAALDLVFRYTPEIPLWVQLPLFKKEGMINQFLEGLPGFDARSDQNVLDTSGPDFDEEMTRFFEDYLTVTESTRDPGASRFALSGDRGKGFQAFLARVDAAGPGAFRILKGQVTGPITFGTAVKDQQGRNIFYHPQLRDASVKRLAMNARWQAREFADRGALPVIFLDEPALAGFGTSAYITITREDVIHDLEEISREIHAENGLTGVHVCANTEWDLLLGADIDIISFDAFSYFDRFILYPEKIRAFLDQGGILAWGIVPTAKSDIIARQTADGLVQRLHVQMDEVCRKTGLDKPALISQSLITPSCGTGSIDLDAAVKVLELTRDVSAAFRQG